MNYEQQIADFNWRMAKARKGHKSTRELLSQAKEVTTEQLARETNYKPFECTFSPEPFDNTSLWQRVKRLFGGV